MTESCNAKVSQNVPNLARIRTIGNLKLKVADEESKADHSIGRHGVQQFERNQALRHVGDVQTRQHGVVVAGR